MTNDPLVKDFYEDLKTVVEAPERQSFFRISKDAGKTWSRSSMMRLDGLASIAAYDSATVRADGRCLLFLSGSAPQPPGSTPQQQFGASGPLVYCSTRRRHRLPLPVLRGARPQGRPGLHVSARDCARRTAGCCASCAGIATGPLRSGPKSISATTAAAPASSCRARRTSARRRAPVLMSDGRLVLVYGRRMDKPGIRAVVSEDGGTRAGARRSSCARMPVAGTSSYPRAGSSPGKVGVIYYYNDKGDPLHVKTDAWPPSGRRWRAVPRPQHILDRLMGCAALQKMPPSGSFPKARINSQSDAARRWNPVPAFQPAQSRKRKRPCLTAACC